MQVYTTWCMTPIAKMIVSRLHIYIGHFCFVFEVWDLFDLLSFAFDLLTLKYVTHAMGNCTSKLVFNIEDSTLFLGTVAISSGPILFSCYTSPISFIADTFGISIQQYADDTQLYVSLTTTDIHAWQSLLSDCLCALHSWFCHNGLSLNSSKSESILIGTHQRLRTFPPVASPTIAGIPIPFSETIKTLGSHTGPTLDIKQACFLTIAV